VGRAHRGSAAVSAASFVIGAGNLSVIFSVETHGRDARATIKTLSDASDSAYFGFVSETLVVNEIYLSLQGESTFAGLPCIFVRLTACNLRCSYCDSAYAFTEGKKQSFEVIRTEIHRLAKHLIIKAFH
jgi:hypothetical protein